VKINWAEKLRKTNTLSTTIYLHTAKKLSRVASKL